MKVSRRGFAVVHQDHEIVPPGKEAPRSCSSALELEALDVLRL